MINIILGLALLLLGISLVLNISFNKRLTIDGTIIILTILCLVVPQIDFSINRLFMLGPIVFLLLILVMVRIRDYAANRN